MYHHVYPVNMFHYDNLYVLLTVALVMGVRGDLSMLVDIVCACFGVCILLY